VCIVFLWHLRSALVAILTLPTVDPAVVRRDARARHRREPHVARPGSRSRSRDDRRCDPVAGTRNVFAERVTGGYYLDFKIKRDQIARYNLSVADVEMTIESAIGGANVTTTIEGRERYRSTSGTFATTAPTSSDPPHADRHAERRADPARAGRRDQHGRPVRRSSAPSKLSRSLRVHRRRRSRPRRLRCRRQGRVAKAVKLPPGYTLEWSGQYEYMQRAAERLQIVIPITLGLVIVLLLPQHAPSSKVGIVLARRAVLAHRGVLGCCGCSATLSVAVWVRLIALPASMPRPASHAPVPLSILRPFQAAGACAPAGTCRKPSRTAPSSDSVQKMMR